MIFKNQIINKLNKLNKVYKTTGKDFLVSQCLNPKHKDKNPSFSINTKNGFGFCFTCGYKVDKDFWTNGKIDEEENERISMYEQLKTKYKFAEDTGGDCNIYIKDIVLPPKSSDLDFLCDKRGFYRGIHLSFYNKLRVYYCNKGKYKNRIVFPIKNNLGIIEAFTTRTLEKNSKIKYIHSKGFKSKSIIYPYELLQNSSKPFVVLVEGIMDTLSMWQKGIPSICNWGVADNFDSDKIASLLALGIEEIYIALDRDKAGISATQTIIDNKLLQENFEVKLGVELRELQEYYKSDCKDYNEFLEGIVNANSNK